MTSDFSNPGAPAPNNQNPLEAARQLEAYFLRRILSEVGPGGAFGGKGVAGSTFRGMFEEALADAISETGQVGLAETIASSMVGEGGQRASADVAANAIWADVTDTRGQANGEAVDPQRIADVALAERLRGTDVPDIDGARALNPGQKGTTPTMGGE